MNRKTKIAGSLILALFGALVTLDAGTMPPPRSGGGLGPGFLPFWIGAAVLLLSLGQFVYALREGGASSGRGAWPEPRNLRRVGYMLGALMVFLFLSNLLGFFLSSWLFLALGMKLLANYRWWAIAGGGLVGAAAITAIFRVWLTLPLPTGLVGL